jgi:hypothetical protein
MLNCSEIQSAALDEGAILVVRRGLTKVDFRPFSEAASSAYRHGDIELTLNGEKVIKVRCLWLEQDQHIIHGCPTCSFLAWKWMGKR